MKDLLSIAPSPSFSKELPADPVSDNYPRQVFGACFSYVSSKIPKKPELLHVSKEYLKELSLTVSDQNEFLNVMSGAQSFNDFKSFAMCYGGHQFGHWAGQLGDGRAINIAELEIEGKPFQFQLKGSGPTPYSRTADGLAVLRSSIREYLCSEAMHHLGVPTTRALSLVKTGDMVPRDMLYNGNQQDELGAIVCRVAPSFIRFGNFDIFGARKEINVLEDLIKYTIKNHFPHLGEPSKETYLKFFREVTLSTKDLMVHWQRVGFVHGVMNTDNLSILGLTIDYGPYGWLEDYNPGWTPNTTDAQHHRYAYGNQPKIALWNLTQLANAIYPLINEVEPFQEILDEYKTTYLRDYQLMMNSKLGLYESAPDSLFTAQLEELLQTSEVDMTLFFRELSNRSLNDFDDFWAIIEFASYKSEEILSESKSDWQTWYLDYHTKLGSESLDVDTRQVKMKAVNPKYVLRNYMAQLAIDDANEGNYDLIDELYQLLLKPYDEQPEMEKWYAKRPDWAKHKVGCSMLSCSS